MFKKLLATTLVVTTLVVGVFTYQIFHAPQAKAACGNGYSFCNTITTDHTKAGSSDTSNFAMLFSTSTMSSLATVGNSGNIQNTTTQTNGQSITVPADLVFTSDSACTTKLQWEYETYNSVTGAVNIWVNIGTLSHTADITIYLCYGNSSVTTYQGNVNGTWDSNYQEVWHMADNAASTTVIDSSVTGNNMTNSRNTSGGFNSSGQVDGAQNYRVANNDNASSVSTTPLGNNTTWSIWVKTSGTLPGGFARIMEGQYDHSYYLGMDGTNTHFEWIVNSIGTSGVTSTSTVATSTWYNLVGTFDGTTSKFYVNGASQGTFAATPPGSTNLPFFISQYYAGGFGWDGIIDEVKISTTPRSADEILSDYNNQSSPNTFYVVGAQQSGTVTVTYHSQKITNNVKKITNNIKIIQQ